MYTYVENNPLAWVDAFGLCKEDSLLKKFESFVQSSDILTTVGAFTIGALERVYDIEQKLRHPLKSLGEATVNTMESMYDFEKAAYNILYDLGYSGTSSQLYTSLHDIGSGRSTLGRDIVNIASQSDLLSADPYTAGHAWGSLTVDAEIVAILSHARVKIKTHPAHHMFPVIGKYRHLQITPYLKSVKYSHINLRLPLGK
jgi:hypothetical protein